MKTEAEIRALKWGSKMKMNIDKEWLLHMAGLEANAIISVGGLVHEIASDVSSVPTMPEHTSDWKREAWELEK